MLRSKNRILAFLVCICALLLSACTEPRPDDRQEPTSEVQQESFSCSAVNGQGQTVRAFFAEADGLWYLAIPSSWDPAEVELRCSGAVIQTGSDTGASFPASMTGVFAKSGDQAVLQTDDGTQVTVKLVQSDLPSVQITLDGVTLDQVHADKDQKHKGSTVLITGADGSVDVASLNNVELKGRGNSTWRMYEKKGYQIKFGQATSVLGMEQAKKWVLLSNASDDSMVRTRVAYEAAKQLGMEFVPDLKFVELWIDGDYRGTYLIGEKVEINSSRLDLQDPLGGLFERDDAFYTDEDYWVHNDYLNSYFVLKESATDEEQLYRSQLEAFSGKVDRLMQYLYATPSDQVTLASLSGMIDVDSFALYYLVNEYFQNRESMSTSFYWYWDDAVLHLGPVWDFDTCMGNDGALNTENYCYDSLLFRYLLASPQFYQRTQELYLQYRDVFDSMAANAETLGTQIDRSAQINYLRWNALGQESTKLNGTAFSGSYAEAVNTLKNWLAGRAKVFEIPRTRVVASTVSEDYGTLHIRYSDENTYESLRFVLWNRNLADSPVMWYDGILVDGEWTTAADLGFFQEKGLYQISVYAPDSEEPIASGVNYVARIKENPHTLEVVLSEDMNEATVTVADPLGQCDSISLVIWSTVNSQDDLQVFDAERTILDGWRCTVDLSGFEAEGEYNLHVFANTSMGSERINATTFIRYRIWSDEENPYLIDAQFNDDKSKLTITLTEPTNDCRLVNLLVWSSAGGQADLQVFPAEKTADGQWRYIVDMTQFEVVGEYNIHAFGEKPYGYIKLNTAVFIYEPTP